MSEPKKIMVNMEPDWETVNFLNSERANELRNVEKRYKSAMETVNIRGNQLAMIYEDLNEIDALCYQVEKGLTDPAQAIEQIAGIVRANMEPEEAEDAA